MEVSSVSKLCNYLISTAIQRCRLSEHLCRLSVVLKCSSAHPPSICISVSDTGAGSSLDEFKGLKYSRGSNYAESWDGVISVTTTAISDGEIYRYQLNVKETSSVKRLTKLPSSAKNGAKFSGTEVSLSTSVNIDDFLTEMTRFIQKMLIPKSPKVAIELAVEYSGTSGPQHNNVIIVNECDHFPSLTLNLDRLKLGFGDYVTKHGNCLNNKCPSCLQSWDNVKAGSGTACSMDSNKSAGRVMEAIIMISQSSEDPSNSCIRASSAKTEVLYFKDLSPGLITDSCINALNSIEWKSYGLSLKSVVDEDGQAVLQWENLPPHVHIDIVLHCYHKQVKVPALRVKAQVERNLVKKAVKNALDDLKVKHAGSLLSTRAVKICSYAADLAKTIAGLILCSNDSSFQGECISLLGGVNSQDMEGESIEENIKEKIIAVIEMNDRKAAEGNKTHFLFEDDDH